MSLNRADIYGMLSDRTVMVAPTTVGGPNQGAVSPTTNSGPTGTVGSAGSAAFTWIGFLLALIILRLLIDFGGKE
jgi:hypothetical protein